MGVIPDGGCDTLLCVGGRCLGDASSCLACALTEDGAPPSAQVLLGAQAAGADRGAMAHARRRTKRNDAFMDGPPIKYNWYAAFFTLCIHVGFILTNLLLLSYARSAAFGLISLNICFVHVALVRDPRAH